MSWHKKTCVGYGGGEGAKLLERALLSQLPPHGLLSLFRAQTTCYGFEEIAYRPVAKQSGDCMVN